MSRWASVVEFESTSMEQRADGTWAETSTRRSVFANRRTIGATAFLAARSAGLHADASVEVRSADYHGEQSCMMGGVPYEVESVSDSGEFSVLTLARRVSSHE